MEETFENEGKPVKSTSTIRAALEALRPEESDKKIRERGPLFDGYRSDYPITVATFHDPEMAKRFQKRLSEKNVYSKLVSGFAATNIIVDAEDSTKAAEIFKATRSEFPNHKPKRLSRRFDYLIFGILMGATLSLTLVVNVMHHRLAATVPIAFCIIGALLGHLIDRFRSQRAIHGKIQMGILEFLILATVPIFIILLVQLVPKMIFT